MAAGEYRVRYRIDEIERVVHVLDIDLNETPEALGVLLVPHLVESWHTAHMDATLVLGQQGRIVIPAEVRAALGLAPGDQLHLHVSGSRLVLERQRDAVAELRAITANVPRSRSFVDELLAERRVAAASE